MNTKLSIKQARKIAIVAELQAKSYGSTASHIAVMAFKLIKGVYVKSINPFGRYTQDHRDFRTAFKASHKAFKAGTSIIIE